VGESQLMLRLAIRVAAVAACVCHTPLIAAPQTTVMDLVTAVRAKAKALESSNGMKWGFQSFTSKFRLQPSAVSYSDYAVARLLFEATRDAGFWNLHWKITNLPPNSDRIWSQWKSVEAPSATAPTASAECDELSALYAFLAAKAGIRGIGLLWPTPDHTVAAWTLKNPAGPAVRVVIPTTQIYLDESDYWGTRKFDPWRQKAIYDYARADAVDSFELPQQLFDFFLQQASRYGGATDPALQLLRYWRENLFLRAWTPEAARQEALRVLRNRKTAPPEDAAAFRNFAEDMRSVLPRR
jgi:hypothetical protein